ncbi:unnamed protein product [Schistosoma mattheei]|uniref:Uncharacterized protein n=1 Tax=Schistosoma mattheei TaxID=31246 RepID=A0AA85BKF2_9TREM|nr:unnamed protein product [Schistosoma mattheei]
MTIEIIEKYAKSRDKKLQETTVNEKPIFIQLDIKSVDVTGSINMKLQTALTNTYAAAGRIVLSKETCFSTQSKVDRYPFHVITTCVYIFTCIYKAVTLVD